MQKETTWLEIFTRNTLALGRVESMQDPLVLAEIFCAPYEIINYFVGHEFEAVEDFIYIFKPNGRGCCQICPRSHNCGQIKVMKGSVLVIQEAIPFKDLFIFADCSFRLKIGRREIIAHRQTLGRYIEDGVLKSIGRT